MDGTRSHRGGVRRRERGFALITVLWFMMLLAAVGAYMAANARSQTALAHNMLAGVRAEAVADAAIARTVYALFETDPEKQWRLDGTIYKLALPGGEATVQIFDERSKINPNLASDVLLSHLFEALGIDRVRSGHIGAAIADWVQKGEQPRPLGAKLPQYQQAGRKYGPPQAPLETMDDLELVLGMTPAFLAAARPYLTIYTDEPTPTHLKIAGLPVLKAVEAAMHDPATNSTGVAVRQGAAPAPPAPPVATPAGQTAAPPSSLPIVTVETTARSFDGGVFSRRAVIKLDFTKPNGYTILDWRRLALPG